MYFADPPTSLWSGVSRLLINDVVVNGEDQTSINSCKFSDFATLLLLPMVFTHSIPVRYVTGCATPNTAPRNAVLRSIARTQARPDGLRSSAPTSISKSPFKFI